MDAPPAVTTSCTVAARETPGAALRRAGRSIPTPRDRDRFVDLLRAGSIAAVVLGHWTIAAIWVAAGRVHVTSALAMVPALQPATWLFQVMGVFFFVAGFANATTIDRLAARGSRAGAVVAAFWRIRLERLLGPTIAFAVVGAVAVVLAGPTRIGGGALSDVVARTLGQPLWFLAVYLVVVLAAPAHRWLHRRRPLLTATALVMLTLSAAGAPDHGPLALLGWSAYASVFLLCQQLGFAYADGALQAWSRSRLLVVAGGALAVLGGLVATGSFPLSMVGVPGEARSNMSPPTICIVVLTVAQVFLLLAARGPLTRWLERPRVWSATVLVNLRVMTVFLWHLPALVVTAVVLRAVGAAAAVPGSGTWWALRPVWLLAAAVVLGGLVALFGRFESMPGRATAASVAQAKAAWFVGLATVVALAAVTALALHGFTAPVWRPLLAVVGLVAARALARASATWGTASL